MLFITPITVVQHFSATALLLNWNNLLHMNIENLHKSATIYLFIKLFMH